MGVPELTTTWAVQQCSHRFLFSVSPVVNRCPEVVSRYGSQFGLPVASCRCSMYTVHSTPEPRGGGAGVGVGATFATDRLGRRGDRVVLCGSALVNLDVLGVSDSESGSS